jgi:hypothetical protein
VTKWGNACTAFLLGLPLLAALPSCSLAAEIKRLPARGNRVLVLITGEITPGDADTFSAAVKEANGAGKLVANVRLNSEGGNLLEGVKLADAVRFGKISTNIGRNATCASACFLVFAAGSSKFADYTAQIGVHGASDQAGNETTQSDAATVSMARIAKELGVPSSIIGRMVVTPPTEMVWLSPQELQSMGTTMVGKPAQTSASNLAGSGQIVPQTPQQTAPGNPIDLLPSTRASTPPSWDQFVDFAVNQSAQQNNGKPITARVCQPALKTCSNAVMYLANGTEIMVKVTRDLNDGIILREVCSFNGQGDIRVCLDWDTGRKHRDMQNSNGDWIKVADE